MDDIAYAAHCMHAWSRMCNHHFPWSVSEHTTTDDAQDACACLADKNAGGTLIVADSFAATAAALPMDCSSAPFLITAVRPPPTCAHHQACSSVRLLRRLGFMVVP